MPFTTNRPLSEAFNPKNNSLGFLRFFLAALVMYSHTQTLGAFGHEGVIGGSQDTYGGIAVSCFFIISGFLITGSYRRTNSIFRFLWCRALRILPGFWICNMITILVFAPILHYAKYHTLGDYLYSHPFGPIRYFISNFFVATKQTDINNLTAGLPFPGVFNGSLWTLGYEIKCYLVFAALGWVGILSRKRWVILILFLLYFLLYVLDSFFPGTAAKISPSFANMYNYRFPIYFLAGSVMNLYADKIVISKHLFYIFSAIFILSLNHSAYYIVAPITLSYALFSLAIYLPFSSLDKYGDFSYGLYIYAFPVQQILSFFRINQYGMISYFILSLMLTLPLSIMSWFLIEKPFLSMKNFPKGLQKA